MHVYLAGMHLCACKVPCAACACCASPLMLPATPAAGNLAVLAEQATERARANEQEALNKARSAEAARQQLAAGVEALERDKAAAQLAAGKLQQQLERLQTELDDLQVGGMAGCGGGGCVAAPLAIAVCGCCVTACGCGCCVWLLCDTPTAAPDMPAACALPTWPALAVLTSPGCSACSGRTRHGSGVAMAVVLTSARAPCHHVSCRPPPTAASRTCSETC